MSDTIQTIVMEAIEDGLSKFGLRTVIQKDFSNSGTIAARNPKSLTPGQFLYYNFQSGYFSFEVSSGQKSIASWWADNSVGDKTIEESVKKIITWLRESVSES